MAKQPAKERTHEWGVYILRKKAQRIGRVHAKDEKEALQRAYEEFEIAVTDRFRLSVQRV